MQIVFCDVDGTLREGKNSAVSKNIIGAASQFIRNNGELYPITGAPASHLPSGWEKWTSGAYVEEGGVLVLPTGEFRIRDQEAQGAVNRLRARLGIEVDDGWVSIPRIGSVIVEGPRWASLTMLAGSPPHYPGLIADVSLLGLVPLVREQGFKASPGEDTVYKWLDCVLSGKESAVQPFLGKGRVFYLGDGRNDVRAMMLPGVIPVGFSNSIPEIRELARERGIFINLLAYAGGVAEFFRRLNDGNLS